MSNVIGSSYDGTAIAIEVIEQGPPGLSAYGVAVKNGFVGTEASWLNSLKPPSTAWQKGNGVPSNTLGSNGDYYLNTSNGDIYGPKANNIWGSTIFNIAEGQQGPAGAASTVPGPAGATGPAGTDGKTLLNGSGAPSSGLGTNGDFYIDTAASRIYGPKAIGVWGSSTSLVGATGATGATGSAGTAGTAATIAVGTVSTGAAGSSAAVTNVGTESAATFNFTIPRGETGATGAAGSAGPAGSAGATGATGAAGAAGAAATIAVGTVSTGAAGSSVVITNTGSSSAAVFAFSIPRGDTGAAGATGATGPAGTTDYNALSNKPTLGTAAATAATNYATAAQGAKADTAVQPAGLSTYIQTSDSRLSDSREWSADTIGQVEAEAGTATTRRAFTAVRVFQAVAAWWAASTAATKLSSIATGATANATDAQLRDRSTHTGTQAASSITGLATVATSGVYSDLSGKPGFATVATSGAYADLSGKPSLGTAATHDVATSGDASFAQVVKGNDSRLSDARAPVAHNQAASTITGLATVATSGSAGDLGAGTLPAARLPTSGVTAGAYGASTLVPIITVDETGRITAASTAAVSGGGGGSGTVTSVSLSLPNLFSVSGSPVTTTGTLTATLATQSANVVLAGPTTGTAAAPTFRALVAADLPATAVTAGSYGTASAVPQFTVDAAGRLTAAAPVNIAIGAGAVSGLSAVATSGSASDLSAGSLPAARLPATAVSAGSYTYGSFTVDAAGRLTAASSGTAPVTSVTGTAPIVSSGGATPAISISAASTGAAGSMSASDKSKLDGVAANATANSTDAQLRDRGTHTGTQSASTITGLGSLATQSATLPSGALVGTTDTQALTGKTLGSLKETVYTITDGAAFEIDPANGPIQTITLGANRTPAATNFTSGESVKLKIDDGTAYAITWATVGVVWIGQTAGASGTAPTLGTTGWTHVELWKEGSIIYGALIGYSAT